MIIGYDNKYSLSTLTASDEEPSFPIERSQDIRLSRLYKSLTTSINVVIDLGSDLTATAFFLANHNLTSSATITLEGNDTNAWTTPTYTNSIAYSSDIIYEVFATQTYRYWRIVIADATNPDELIKFGGVFLGTYLTAPNFSHVLTEAMVDTSVISRSLSGQVYIDTNYDYITYSLNHPRVTESGRDSLKAMMKANKKKPVYMLLDETSTTEFIPFYGTIDDISYSRVFDDFYTISTNIREAK